MRHKKKIFNFNTKRFEHLKHLDEIKQFMATNYEYLNIKRNNGNTNITKEINTAQKLR